MKTKSRIHRRKVMVFGSLLFILSILSSTAFGQDIRTLDDMIELGRSALIDLGVKRINENPRFAGFDVANFDRIAVWTAEEYLWVSFNVSVKFIPLGTSSIYGMSVYLFGQEGHSYSEVRNPDGLKKSATVYTGLGEDAERVHKILEVIGYEDGVPDWLTISITERDRHYEIQEMSASSGALYNLKKSSWQIYDEYYEELAIDEDDTTREIR